MKRLLTLALIIASLQTAFAQYGSSILNIKASDNSMIGVVVDGRDMGLNDNAITVNNLRPGSHYLRIYRLNKLMPDGRLTMFEGHVQITASSETYSTVLIGMNKLRMDRIVAINYNPNPWQQPGKPIMPQAPVYPNQCEPAIPIGPMAMADYDFERLRCTLEEASFESTRMMILKQALNYNYFTTAQVRALMNEFWFESSKLEVAKVAYTKTVDPNNYYLVNNEFSFGSSVRELGDYLAMN